MNGCRDLFRAVMALLVLLCFPMLARGCSWGSYDDCQPWPSCTHSCGGGERCRICESCFWRKDKTFCEGCNYFCYNGGEFLNGRCVCPAWRTGYCCQTCINVTIEHCMPGKQVCGGSPDGVKCTQCLAGYVPGDYGEGCLLIGGPVHTTVQPIAKTTVANNYNVSETGVYRDVANDLVGPVMMIILVSLFGTFGLMVLAFFIYKRFG